jgi:hypothetical protein
VACAPAGHRDLNSERGAGTSGRCSGYQGRRWLLCTTGRKVLPALSPVAACGVRVAQASMPCDGAVAVQNCPGEGASCRALVSTTPSRPWNELPRGRPRPRCLPGERSLVRPLLLPALRAASPTARGGCWPRCATVSAASLPGLAGAAGGWAALPGRPALPRGPGHHQHDLSHVIPLSRRWTEARPRPSPCASAARSPSAEATVPAGAGRMTACPQPAAGQGAAAS